jgi:hypothetical protein
VQWQYYSVMGGVVEQLVADFYSIFIHVLTIDVFSEPTNEQAEFPKYAN